MSFQWSRLCRGQNSKDNEPGPISLTMAWNIWIKFGIHIDVDKF